MEKTRVKENMVYNYGDKSINYIYDGDVYRLLVIGINESDNNPQLEIYAPLSDDGIVFQFRGTYWHIEKKYWRNFIYQISSKIMDPKICTKCRPFLYMGKDGVFNITIETSDDGTETVIIFKDNNTPDYSTISIPNGLWQKFKLLANKMFDQGSNLTSDNVTV